MTDYRHILTMPVHYTDPRRRHFVRLQSVLFSFGSVGLFAGLILWMQIEGDLESFTLNPSDLKVFRKSRSIGTKVSPPLR